jgi:signal transduction histidine kinase/ligand-binding sensor domain-containing protein
MNKLIIVLTFIFSGFITFGQPPDLRFQDIESSTPLSSQDATCMAQDSTGFIWIGTSDGLNRYNGNEIKQYKWIPGDSTSISDNEILGLFTDSDSILWIITRHGLCRYLPATDNFRRLDSLYDEGVPVTGITRIKEYKKQHVVFSALNKIYSLSPETGKTKVLATIDTGEITAFDFDTNNNLWIGSRPNSWLYQFDKQGRLIRKIIIPFESEISNPSYKIRDLVCMDNKVYVATFGGGLAVYNDSAATFSFLLTDQPYFKYVNNLYLDNENNLWSSDVTGLKVYDTKNKDFFGYYTNSSDPQSVGEHAVGIFHDRQGNYWTYHSNGGVRISPVPRGFYQFSKSNGTYWHTSSNYISSVSEDNHGNLWLGNPFAGIDVFFWQQGVIKHFAYDENNPHSLGKGAVFDIFCDNKDTLWIGTNLGGLQYFDPKSEQFISYLHDENNPSSIANNDVRSIAEDKNGDLWLVVHGKGVDHFIRKTRTFHHYNQQNSNLSNDFAFKVLYTTKDELWVGGVWGVSVLKPGEKNFKNYYFNVDDSTTLSSNEIECFYEDSEGTVWIGTRHGLNRFNDESETFTQYLLGFNDLHICAITGDVQGFLWITTIHGLTRLNPKTGETFNFVKSNGIPFDEFVPRSVYKNKQNNIFFGGLYGLIQFNPEQLKFNTTAPNILITGYQLSYNSSDKTNNKTRLIPHGKRISLDYNQNAITFQYVALNMIHPSHNKYKYRLMGLERNWNYAGTKREATYTNLDPGTYVFEVTGSNNDGVWNTKGESVTLKIYPPWWGTWYFRLAAVILLIALTLGLIELRTRNLLRQQRKLTGMVEEKTLELEEMNEELEEMNEELQQQAYELETNNRLLQDEQQRIEEQSAELQLKNEELQDLNEANEKIFTIIAHDLRSPFNALLGLSGLLVSNHNKYDSEKRGMIISQLQQSLTTLYRTTENLLNWSSRHLSGTTLHQETFNLNTQIIQNIEFVRSYALQKSIDLLFDSEKQYAVYADPNMTDAIIRNLLSNAIKFSENNEEIIIRLFRQDQKIICSVTDFGSGMTKDEQQNLFKTSQNTRKTGTSGEKGSGLGLMICSDFIRLNNGEIWVESEEGKGSTFYFSLPEGSV